MSGEEREKIMEKRSSMRSWRERGGKMRHNVELTGAALIIIIFLGLIASSYWSSSGGNITSPADIKKTPIPTPVSVPVSLSPGSIPAPGIKINSPQNVTYNMSTPPLDFIVVGSGLDKVLLSVDDGPSVVVPDDGTIAKIDFAKLNPLFLDDFSGAMRGQWKESGNWSINDGKYVTAGGGTSSFGDTAWDDYIIETKTRIVSGNDVTLDLRWDGQSNYYPLKTGNAYNTFLLNKATNRGINTLVNAQTSTIDPSEWHTWRIIANSSEIKALIDEIPYIDYTDTDGPYLKGNIRLRVANSNVEYDYVQVYKSLPDGVHKLTIFANNTAGNSSIQTVYFDINTTSIEAEEEIVGKIGMPVIKGGFEITVKSATPALQYTNVWISVKNIGDKEKTLKLGPGNIVIDNKGQQYENIKVPKAKDISQIDLYPQMILEGGVYFERISDNSRSLKKLILYVNGEKVEFMLDAGA